MLFAAANPSLDKTFEVERLLPGEIHRPAAFVTVPGGKAVNAARAAAALGARPRVLALLGGAAGAQLRGALEADGVAVAAVDAGAPTRSCLSVLDRAAGSLTEFYEDGPPPRAGAWEELAELVVAACASRRWLAIAGSLPAGVPAGAYGELTAAARARGALVALDASGPALAAALAAEPDLVKVNAAEAGELLGAAGPAPELAAGLRGRLGPEGVVAVTDGAAGAALCAGGRLLTGSTPALADAPHAVGSGDSFFAGLLVAREQGGDWEAALALALGAGAANAELPGAARLRPDRARELAGQASIEVLCSR